MTYGELTVVAEEWQAEGGYTSTHLTLTPSPWKRNGQVHITLNFANGQRLEVEAESLYRTVSALWQLLKETP